MENRKKKKNERNSFASIRLYNRGTISGNRFFFCCQACFWNSGEKRNSQPKILPQNLASHGSHCHHGHGEYRIRIFIEFATANECDREMPNTRRMHSIFRWSDKMYFFSVRCDDNTVSVQWTKRTNGRTCDGKCSLHIWWWFHFIHRITDDKERKNGKHKNHTTHAMHTLAAAVAVRAARPKIVKHLRFEQSSWVRPFIFHVSSRVNERMQFIQKIISEKVRSRGHQVRMLASHRFTQKLIVLAITLLLLLSSDRPNK